MSDYFHEQMVNKMLEPKERDFSCKECFIFKIEEERVNQFIANYKAQRVLLKNAEVIQTLEDVRAEIAEYGSIWVEYTIKGHTDMDIKKIIKDVLKQAKTQVLELIDRKIAEVTKNCTSCTHSDELDGEYCYECVKGNEYNFEADEGVTDERDSN